MNDTIIKVFELTGSVTIKSVQDVIEICDYETKEFSTDNTEFRQRLVELKQKCTI